MIKKAIIFCFEILFNSIKKISEIVKRTPSIIKLLISIFLFISLGLKIMPGRIKEIIDTIKTWDRILIIKMIVLFWFNLIILGIYDLLLLLLHNLNFQIYYQLSKKGNMRLSRFITECYYLFEKLLNKLSPDLITVKGSFKKNKFRKISSTSPINLLKNLISIIFYPFKFNFWNMINWIIIIIELYGYAELKLLLFNKQELKTILDYYKYYAQIISKNKVIITQVGTLIGSTNLYRVIAIYNKRKEKKQEKIMDYQEDLVKVIKDVLPKLEHNINLLFERKDVFLDYYLKELTGTNRYLYCQDEITIKENFNCIRPDSEQFFERLKDTSESINSIKNIIKEIESENMMRLFIETNYYIKFEFYHLNLNYSSFFDSKQLTYLDKKEFKDMFYNRLDDKFIKEKIMGFSYKRSELKDDFNELNYYDEKVKKELKKLKFDINDVLARAIKEYVFLKQYLSKHDKFINSNNIKKFIVKIISQI